MPTIDWLAHACPHSSCSLSISLVAVTSGLGAGAAVSAAFDSSGAPRAGSASASTDGRRSSGPICRR